MNRGRQEAGELGAKSAGYSGKPLAQKLGIKRGQLLTFLNAPHGYHVLLGELPDGVIVTRQLRKESDLIQFFARDTMSLKRDFPRLKSNLKRDGMIWISWPKGSSQLQSDLSENVVRKIGLRNGLVDVKICAVDQTWSALKFVIPLKDRP